MLRLAATLFAIFCLASGVVTAQDIFKEAKASFIFNGERVNISRENQEPARIATRFSINGAECGEPCIAPMVIAEGIETFGELDVLAFLVNEVAGNTGLMVDARMPADRAKGFIPGTVSLPYATLSPENEFKDEILRALGVREIDGMFTFTDARELLVYDNGPSADDAGKLVRNLLDEGYPASKIRYYRGGMQVWAILGFSIKEVTS